MPRRALAKTPALASVHESAAALQRVGALTKTTMREFDALCLEAPRALTPTEIKAIRETARLSQPVFASYLGTSESTIQKWERGEKRPSGPALKLLSIVAKRGIEILV